jgi:xylulose-5-phosphate/fructose-6-phosphate phosphoketolase
MPDFRDYASTCPGPGTPGIGDTHVLGPFLRDVIKVQHGQRNFRVFGPDETLSNGLEAVFEVTPRQWNAATQANDQFLAPTGRVMEMLSEHQCEGWLEGYLLTGRHGLFNCYEAFIHIVDSMFNQHAKWLKVTSHHSLAAQDRLVQLLAGLACLAPGSQRLHPSRSRVLSTMS